MGRVGRADELIVRDSEESPDLLCALGYSVYQFLGRHFSFGRGLRDLLSVLVHSDEEVDLIAHEAVIACYGVGADFLERVTLVRISRGVIDCAGEEVLGQL